MLFDVKNIPLVGGAFFIETTKVAMALRTNDISDSLNLQTIKNFKNLKIIKKVQFTLAKDICRFVAHRR